MEHSILYNIVKYIILCHIILIFHYTLSDNDYGTIISFKLVLPNISLNMNVLKIIQAYIQSIVFNKKVLQRISSASKTILVLKWYYHKQYRTWNFVLINWNVIFWNIQNITN